MNRLEFIFSAMNTIASRKQSPMIECLLAQAVFREIETLKREFRMKAAAVASSPSSQVVLPKQGETFRQLL
jgi:hypothetical protein